MGYSYGRNPDNVLTMSAMTDIVRDEYGEAFEGFKDAHNTVDLTGTVSMNGKPVNIRLSGIDEYWHMSPSGFMRYVTKVILAATEESQILVCKVCLHDLTYVEKLRSHWCMKCFADSAAKSLKVSDQKNQQ